MTSLADPVELAGRTAPSRVLFGPHETNLGSGRAFSDRHVAYYARRAAGGAGIVVTETASVHDSDWPYERAPLAADCGPGWARIAEACHEHGALVLASLGHSGSQGSSAFGQQALWAPSRVPDVASRELPVELEQPQLDDLVAGFAAAAELAVQSGVDGVELEAGQYSLLRQFCSGLTNQRGDRYGEDRALLLREVIAAVREAGGVLGLRLSCDELAPWAGITPEQGAELAGSVAAAVDYLVVVRGSAMGTAATRPDLHTEPGFNTELCRTVRSTVDGQTLVALQGSVVDPAMAEQALTDGVADLVEMTRAQIAAPELVSLWRAGHGERIRPCVLCNQRCRVRDNRNPVVSCIGEPASGHETEDAAVTGRDHPARDVLVVGGGPAGLEAARVAALRGNRVELVERADELGGMLRTAARAGGRERLGALADWLAAEVRRVGVTVRTGVTVLATDVAAAQRDGRVVLAATGSVPGPRSYLDEAGTVEAADLLNGADLPDGSVAVLDPVGDAVGVAVAELLAARGRQVAIVSQDQVIGTQLALTGDLADANARLQRAGVQLVKRSTPRAVRTGTVQVQDVFTAEQTEIPADVVVHCGHRLPAPALGGTAIGDAVAPRSVHEAVLEARRAVLGR